MKWTSAFLSAWFIAAAALPVGAAEPDAKGVEFFERKIRPVLVKHCYKCHSAGAKKIKGNLLLDSRDGIRMGGDSGHAVTPGDIDSSVLISAIRFEDFEMPPDKQLPGAVIADFVRWVEMGAPDPRKSSAPIRQKEIDFDESRKFWAFQQPKQSEAPAVQDAGWPRTDIDRYILAGLEANDLKPSADATKRTLLRRVYYDLIGLPPSPSDLAAFLRDDSPHALATVVDRLLKSPQFGERWGRHWLDVARYAESNGRDRNFLYPQAWRYRDYVIAAFNKDTPYDQFVREQLSGDLLPSKDDEDRNNKLLATGFLAIGPKSLNERNREVFRMDIVDEQIDVSTRAIMALTVSCARCHDHKFDPIPTSDYYAMAGVFRSSQTRYGTSGQGNRQASKLLPLATKEAQKEQASKTKKQEQRVAALRDELKKTQATVKRLQGAVKGKNRKKKNKKKAKAAPTDKALADEKDKVDPAQTRKQLVQARRRIKQLNQQIKRAGDGGSSGVGAMGVTEGTVENCRIYIRGEVDNRGDQVDRGYVTILSPGAARKIKSNQSGRKELAEWFTSRDNPLTARVFVNRVWGHLFGHGLVRSVDNFGANGDKPSHPELLDHLAIQFMDQGWSVKKLIRSIVLSRTYQQGSGHDNAAFEKDPQNVYVWRMPTRRLDAESMRDAILQISGKLDLTPAKASLVASYKDSVALGRGLRIQDLSKPSFHRSVYLPIVRNAVPEALNVFDFAEPSILVGRREVTTVPAQALYLMNSTFALEQSEQAARRLLEDTSLSDDRMRVSRAYEMALVRTPSAEEIQRAVKFIEDASAKLADSDAEKNQRLALAAFCQALFASAEFRFVE